MPDDPLGPGSPPAPRDAAVIGGEPNNSRTADHSADPFLAELAAGLDPNAPSAAASHAHGEDGALAIRRSDDLVVIQAWDAGPAGVAILECDHGITVVVDAALPHRFVGATIAPAETGALRRLDPFLGTRAVDALVDAGDTDGEWLPVRARPRETTESVAIGRYRRSSASMDCRKLWRTAAAVGLVWG